jgi:hypothetical protein
MKLVSVTKLTFVEGLHFMYVSLGVVVVTVKSVVVWKSVTGIVVVFVPAVNTVSVFVMTVTTVVEVVTRVTLPIVAVTVFVLKAVFWMVGVTVDVDVLRM